MGMSMTKYLKPIRSANFRYKIRKEAKRKGFVIGKIGTANKEILADSVFTVENDAEHRIAERVGAWRDVSVQAMRGVRNRLYDDLGWNENAGKPTAEVQF